MQIVHQELAIVLVQRLADAAARQLVRRQHEPIAALRLVVDQQLRLDAGQVAERNVAGQAVRGAIDALVFDVKFHRHRGFVERADADDVIVVPGLCWAEPEAIFKHPRLAQCHGQELTCVDAMARKVPTTSTASTIRPNMMGAYVLGVWFRLMHLRYLYRTQCKSEARAEC